MRFEDFKGKFQGAPVILSRDAVKLVKDPQVMLNQLNRWQKRGLLIPLRRGVYLLNKNDRKVPVSNNVIANRLYEPSYLSLEYALNFYLLIPEGVATITSVTTRKTMQFKNDLGQFVYQHIKPAAFSGFRLMEEGGNNYFIAGPEKAVVDFLYLNLSKFRNNVSEMLKRSYRFQNVKGLDQKKIVGMARLFGSNKLVRTSSDFVKWIDEEGG